MRFRSGCCVPAFFLCWQGLCCGAFWGILLGMESEGRLVVEQHQYDDGVRVVVRREESGGLSRLGVTSETFPALAVLLITGCGVVAALTSVVVWNATLWALGFVVASVVLCVLVAGVSGRSRGGSSDVVVDHVFGVEGEFGPGLEELLNDAEFGSDALNVLTQAGRAEDTEVIAVMNRVWHVYRKARRVGDVRGGVLEDVSNRMDALSSALDDVDALSQRSSFGE